MKQVEWVLNSGFRFLLSLCVATMPFYETVSRAETTAEAPKPSPLAQATVLMLDLATLQDRALYPKIPRRGLTGLPTTSEMEQAQSRILAIHKDYETNLAPRIAALSQMKDEVDLFLELNSYFTAVQKYESLRIILKQPSQSDSWDATYGIKIQVNPLNQVYLMAMIGTFSENYVSLPGTILPFADLDAVKNKESGFKSSLELVRGQWQLNLTVNTGFADSAEISAMIYNPSTRNSLLFALYWSARRMVDSHAMTRTLLGRPVTSLPAPPQALMNQFVSLKVRNLELKKAEWRAIFAHQKPYVLEALLDTMDDEYKKNQGWIFDEFFLKSVDEIGIHIDPTKLKEGLGGLRIDERKAFQLTLVSLLNLADFTDLKNWYGQTKFIIYESKRLAMRWLLLGNPEDGFRLDAPGREKLAQLIDDKAMAIANQLEADGSLNQKIYKVMVEHSPEKYRELQRTMFQSQLLIAANKMKEFATQTVNLQYLIGAQRPAVEKMGASSLVTGILDSIYKQKSYGDGYVSYRQILFTYLQAFTMHSPLKSPISLSHVFAQADRAKWNPQALLGTMDAKYVEALNATGDARVKDLQDLVELGKILKFDVYEKTLLNNDPNSNPSPVTVTSLGLSDPNRVAAYFFGSERDAYLLEMKKDLLTHAPLLAGPAYADDRQAGSGGEMAWELLNRPDVNFATKTEVVNTQLARVEKQIGIDNASLIDELKKVTSNSEDNLKGVGEELRTLVTRAAQIQVGLNSFAGFSDYYSEIRDQLVLPSFAGREWNDFTTWNNKIGTYLIEFYVFQLVTRASKIGLVTDAIASFFAPVFGPNFKWLNRFMIGMVAVDLGNSGIQGYHFEANRQETLEKYFMCGSAAPCLTTYSDLATQAQIRDAQLSKFYTGAILMVALTVGILGSMAVKQKLALRSTAYRQAFLFTQLEYLGLKETSILSKESIKRATRDAILKARNSLTDPLQIEVAETYIQQAQAQIELAVAQDVSKWQALDERFAKSAERLGLNSRDRNWKNMGSLEDAWVQKQHEFQAGQISTAEFESIRQDLLNMKAVIDPVYKLMEKSPFTRNYTERVWNNLWLKPNLTVSSSQASATESFFSNQTRNSKFEEQFEAALGTRLSRLKMVNGKLESQPENLGISPRLRSVLDRITNEIENNPNVTRARIEGLLNAYRRTGSQ